MMRGNEIIEKRKELPIFTAKEGLTEADCIEKFNRALKAHQDHDCDSESIIYIEISRNEAEILFNELFDNSTFEDYLDTYSDDAEGDIDIVPMWGLLCDVISDDVLYNMKTKELYKTT